MENAYILFDNVCFGFDGVFCLTDFWCGLFAVMAPGGIYQQHGVGPTTNNAYDHGISSFRTCSEPSPFS